MFPTRIKDAVITEIEAEIFRVSLHALPNLLLVWNLSVIGELPDSFLHVDGNQFKCKFYKSDVLLYWIDSNSQWRLVSDGLIDPRGDANHLNRKPAVSLRVERRNLETVGFS